MWVHKQQTGNFMPRRTRMPGRYSPQANKEKKGLRMLKAFRPVDPESSLTIAGVVSILEKDNTIPETETIPHSHLAYILDPHIVRIDFSQGFLSGYSFSRAMEKIKNQDYEDEILSKIGKISIIGKNRSKNRLLCAYVQSPEIVKERQAIYGILGEEGLSGFKGKKIKRVGAPLLQLATFAKPIYDEKQRKEIVEAINYSLAEHRVGELTLGSLEVRAVNID